jgi:hypothetical protein
MYPFMDRDSTSFIHYKECLDTSKFRQACDILLWTEVVNLCQNKRKTLEQTNAIIGYIKREG